VYESPISAFIYFGTAVRYLQDAREGWSIHGKYQVAGNIDFFFAYLEEFELIVTTRAASALKEFGNRLKKSTNEKLNADQARELRKLMDELRPTLVAEADGKIAHIASERRFPIERLLQGPGHLFAANVFAKLPEIAQADFSEAAKCLAFERSTAAAFHMLRGIESTLRHYYCTKVKRKRT
jgi:hypothetical protein